MKFWSFVLAGIVLFISNSANAALVSRLSGLAYYDTEADLTWLADANYAQTSGYDADGRMTWYEANNWAASLEINGVTGWRLPTMIDTGAPGCNTISYSGTDCGYNVNTATSEMANLYYNIFGNSAYYDASGNTQLSYGLDNTGSFINFQSNIYWTGLVDANFNSNIWSFYFNDGRQGTNYFGNSYYALAVQSGDIGASVVPLPAAVWLLGSGLIFLAGVARRK